MADNSISNNPVQCLEENSNQNNSVCLDADKTDNILTPPTLKTSDTEISEKIENVEQVSGGKKCKLM